MAFGMKKKVAPKEEPVVTHHQEATEEEPVAQEAPKPEQLTPAQARTFKLMQEFEENYAGTVANAPDHVRASLQFATYGETYAVVEAVNRTNALLRELIDVVKKGG